MVSHLRLIDGDDSDREGGGSDDGGSGFSTRSDLRSVDANTSGVDQRLALLDRMTSDQIADVLSRQPLVAAGLIGLGSMTASSRTKVVTGGCNRRTIASQLARRAVIEVAIAGLDPIANNLVSLAGWYGGVVTRERAIAESGGLEVDVLDAAAAEVAAHMLSDPARGFVALLSGVPEAVRFPGVLMRDFYVGSATTNDDLAFMLRNLGVTPAKTNRAGLIDAFETALRDGELVQRTIHRLGPAHIAMFNKIAANPYGISMVDAGIGWFSPNYYRSGRYGSNLRAPGRTQTPMHDLFDHGLIHVDDRDQRAWVWLDVRRAITGQLITAWPPPLAISSVPIDDTPAITGAVGLMGAMLDLWSREPASGTKTGGLAVRAARAAAKHVGLRDDHGPMLGRIAHGLGLLQEEAVTTGKGRRMEVNYQFVAGDPARRWLAEPFLNRWVDLVGGWLRGDGFPANEAGFAADRHRFVLGDLARLPIGTGIPETDFPRWFSDRRTFSFGQYDFAAGVLQEMRLLGLVPPTGPVGLYSLARAVVSDPSTAAALMPAPSTTFVVQPDHSVMAPNDLDPDVAARLDRYTEQVSAGAARMLRLDPHQIGREVAAGTDEDDIISFLRTHSSVPVSPAVERLVRDAASAAGGLMVMSATSILVAEDMKGLMRAISVRAAKLTMISQTVAISTLTPEKLLATLRAKGLFPSGDPGIGTSVDIIKLPQSTATKALIAATKLAAGRPLPPTLQPDATLLARLIPPL